MMLSFVRRGRNLPRASVLEHRHRAEPDSPGRAACRFCGTPLAETFVDLGTSPACQRPVEPQRLNRPDPFYRLHAWVCDNCWLVQVEERLSHGEIFGDYAYFSSFSDSWLAHARAYTDLVRERFGIGPSSRVVEIASNDGYLLQYFKAAGVPVLGVEPAGNVAQAALGRGIPTLVRFFERRVAEEIRSDHGPADLIVANNVLGHVPEINDFVAGLKVLLGPRAVATLEFPHLMRLVEQNQFDMIYHEHFSYLSLTTTQAILAAQGLTIFDAEELTTHGGSLRIYVRHSEDRSRPVGPRVGLLKHTEAAAGMLGLEFYRSFGEKVRATKRRILAFLLRAKNEGRRIVGYGAPGKGNTLLNYCGIRTDFIDFTVDKNPSKQGKYLPGSRIPILAPEAIRQARPDYLFILPWNLRDEIVAQNAFIREWGGRFVVPIPELEVLD